MKFIFCNINILYRPTKKCLTARGNENVLGTFRTEVVDKNDFFE